jgi:hypothetical protein
VRIVASAHAVHPSDGGSILTLVLFDAASVTSSSSPAAASFLKFFFVL